MLEGSPIQTGQYVFIYSGAPGEVFVDFCFVSESVAAHGLDDSEKLYKLLDIFRGEAVYICYQ